jgi:hypothetical protein
MDSSDQWLFPLSALKDTPSEITLQEEMIRRQKGVDWLFRVGVSLGMSVHRLVVSHKLRLNVQGARAMSHSRSLLPSFLYASHDRGLPGEGKRNPRRTLGDWTLT